MKRCLMHECHFVELGESSSCGAPKNKGSDATRASSTRAASSPCRCQRGFLVTGGLVLAGGLFLFTLPPRSHGFAGERSRLADLLPFDLDILESPTIISALGVQLLLFGGFVPGPDGWVQDMVPPASLLERIDRIAPTWKPRGNIDYSWPSPSDPPPSTNSSLSNNSPLRLFSTPQTLAVRGAGASVESLADALEQLGLRAADFDAPSRFALREMLTWRIDETQAMGTARDLYLGGDLILLALSFDATPNCRSFDDCPRPGPSNELLAATADQFIQQRWKAHGQRVHVYAQWEVGVAMAKLR